MVHDPAEIAAPTIYDVARECGVAASTVSRAFTRPGRVRPETVHRVFEAAERLGYRTRPPVRLAAGEPTSLIALAVSDVTNPVYFAVIRGAESAAAAAGYSLLLHDTQESARVEQQALARSLPLVEGVVVVSPRSGDAALRHLAQQRPVVVVNRPVPGVPSVVTDNPRGIRRALEHLGALGHRHVTYLAGPEASWTDGARWRAVQEGALELELTTRRLGPFAPTVAGGVLAAEELRQHPASAVVAYNDQLAIGLLRGLAAAGVGVPGEVSVVGFDNSFGSDFCTPSLTTVAAPLRALGTEAVSWLLTQLTGPAAPVGRPVVLPARLVVRESTAPPAPLAVPQRRRKRTSPAEGTTRVSGSAS